MAEVLTKEQIAALEAKGKNTRFVNQTGGNNATAGSRSGEGLYKQVQDLNLGKGSAPSLVPGNAGGGGYIDVINSFRWTTVEMGQAARDDIPYIFLKEYRSTRTGMDLISQGAKLTAALGHNSNPYDGLYSFDDPTGFTYRFPFFTDTYYDLSNTFEQNNPLEMAKGIGEGAKGVLKSLSNLQGAKNKFLKGVGKVGAVGEIMLDAAGKAAAAGEEAAQTALKLTGAAGGNDVGKLDLPMLWASTSTRTTSFKFYLFNTLAASDIKKNWELLHLLRYQNTINKRSIVQATPPVFYEVSIPSQHYTKGAWMSSLGIRSLGTTRRLDPGEIGLALESVHVPDAWEISITLTDFLKPSQNLLHDMTENTTVASKASKQSEGTTTVTKK